MEIKLVKTRKKDNGVQKRASHIYVVKQLWMILGCTYAI